MRFGGGGDEVKTNISGSSIDTALDLRPHHFVFLVVIEVYSVGSIMSFL